MIRPTKFLACHDLEIHGTLIAISLMDIITYVYLVMILGQVYALAPHGKWCIRARLAKMLRGDIDGEHDRGYKQITGEWFLGYD